MNLTEKEISYTTTNSYATLNTLTASTKNVWFVCHGMGFLSRYFLRYFQALSAEENYIIAPQAQSKYYIPPKFKHVGSSWLTKENTVKETENIMRYFDSVLEAEAIPEDVNLIVLGYSQGVSVATRYLVKRQLKCAQLVLHSGGIPKELTENDFDYLSETTKVSLIYGDSDEYLNDERMNYEEKRAQELFGKRLQLVPFQGKHEVNVEIINSLV
ncbi:esterase [Bizionia argentinensis JUB59]|uniref:Esterase n=1 Tax=Bizionia argentinensis JUB59 TaxID=1046627 RepID=G2E9W6_9FLAO|nr:esterase [Bizionia argentinensis]EGV44982.1 esterase [Bizionia argentinensis JUB59]